VAGGIVSAPDWLAGGATGLTGAQADNTATNATVKRNDILQRLRLLIINEDARGIATTVEPRGTAALTRHAEGYCIPREHIPRE
jgi:hypothetical protein